MSSGWALHFLFYRIFIEYLSCPHELSILTRDVIELLCSLLCDILMINRILKGTGHYEHVCMAQTEVRERVETMRRKVEGTEECERLVCRT